MNPYLQPLLALASLAGGEPVAIVSPTDGATVSGPTMISGTSQLTSGQVRVSVDDGPFVLAQGLDPWTFPWNTTGVPDGPHTITARAKSSPQAVPDYHTISVLVDNGAPGLEVAIDSPVDAQVVWGPLTVSGTSSGATSVAVQVDGGPFQHATGTTSWTFALDASALTASDHSITVRASPGGGVFATDAVEVVVNPQSPPAPTCGALHPGTALPYANPIAPVRVDLPGPTTIDIAIIGHSENAGYADDLQALLDDAPPGGHQYVVTNHYIGGQELWRWVTPGQPGYQAVEDLLAQLEGPTFALVLVSNNTSFPITQPSFANANYARFVDECGQLADHLYDGGQGVLRSWFSAHRMKPQNLMPCWFENLAFADVMADAAASGRDHVKPGPAQHDLHWCCYPDCYSSDLSHPGPAGDALMAQAWYQLLVKEFAGDYSLTVSGLVSGGTAGLAVSGAQALAPALLGASTAGMGATPVPMLDLTLDVLLPFHIGALQWTDGAGAASWAIPVPPGLTGLRVWFQSAQFGAKSNAFEGELQ